MRQPFKNGWSRVVWTIIFFDETGGEAPLLIIYINKQNKCLQINSKQKEKKMKRYKS